MQASAIFQEQWLMSVHLWSLAAGHDAGPAAGVRSLSWQLCRAHVQMQCPCGTEHCKWSRKRRSLVRASGQQRVPAGGSMGTCWS